jgi:hypothetical protein
VPPRSTTPRRALSFPLSETGNKGMRGGSFRKCDDQGSCVVFLLEDCVGMGHRMDGAVWIFGAHAHTILKHDVHANPRRHLLDLFAHGLKREVHHLSDSRQAALPGWGRSFSEGAIDRQIACELCKL